VWEFLDEALHGWAIEQRSIAPKVIRIDTMAMRTNIHWPSDTSLPGST
jgi:5-methylcytosine-specific restriction endonuclease McrBC GTP-binding regulatory subunit McrB